MLASLTVRDIVLIDRLAIEFGTGLTVLTGETGAGKSILLDALALALGARGDSGLVRAGAERGEVTALFEPPPDHPVHSLLMENGLAGDGALLLRRTQSLDGKSRAFVNDRPCSAALLKEIGSLLVEIHGQHDERALIASEGHRLLLDAFGRIEADVEAVAARYRDMKELDQQAARLASELEDSAREAEYLRAAVEELEALSPEHGEETTLAERRQFLMRAEKIAADLSDAHTVIAGSASPVPELAGLSRRLVRKSTELPGLLDETVAALSAALDDLDAARLGLEAAMRSCDFDPRELERVEERLFALRSASRKYQAPVDDLAAVAAEFSARLADVDLGSERLGALQRAASEARGLYVTAAQKLSKQRAAAGEALERAVNSELPALRLEAARFKVAQEVDEAAESTDGFDRIAFHVRTNPGTEPGPLMKVASGGELSRFLLALKVALADRGSAPTLVFDEIDAGAGGGVAEAIGRRLARLAERVQVLAVTHAPQVAAQARSHFLISKAKADRGRRVITQVSALASAERREEIARMLAGETISDEARAAAERLMAGAA